MRGFYLCGYGEKEAPQNCERKNIFKKKFSRLQIKQNHETDFKALIILLKAKPDLKGWEKAGKKWWC